MRKQQRFPQGYSAPFIAHRPSYLPVNCGHNSEQTLSRTRTLATFLTQFQSSEFVLVSIFLLGRALHGKDRKSLEL